MRRSKKDLEVTINSINRGLKRLKFEKELRISSQIGEGVRLVECCESGGERELSYRISINEMYYVLDAIDNLVWKTLGD